MSRSLLKTSGRRSVPPSTSWGLSDWWIAGGTEAGKNAWLVIEGNPQRQEIRTWAKQFEETLFGSADGARVYRLDPGRREMALRGR